MGTTELYDLKGECVTRLSDYPMSNWIRGTLVSYKERVINCAGYKIQDNKKGKACYEYDPKSNNWMSVPSLAMKR